MNNKQEFRSCQIILLDSELQKARHNLFIDIVEMPDETIVNEKCDQFFTKSKMCSENESGFWVHFEIYRRRSIQILLRTRKRYPAGPIETGVNQGRFGKAKRYS